MGPKEHGRIEYTYALDPLARLPYEIGILCLIFAIADEWESSAGPLLYMMVSPHWQRMILESPALWTSIVLYNGEDEHARLEAFIHLSEHLPLDIKIVVSSSYRHSLELLWSHKSRIRSVTITWSTSLADLDRKSYDGVIEHIDTLMDKRLMREFEGVAEQMQNPAVQIKIVDTARPVELQMAFDGRHIVFNILDPLTTNYGLNRIPFRINPVVADVCPVIRGAAHYSRCLRRSGNAKSLQGSVKVEFVRLTEVENEYDDDLLPVRQPNGPNLIHEDIIDLNVDEKAIYGIKIINILDKPLYPSVFFLDNSDLSITPYFQPPSSGDSMDAPLPPKGSLTIGYGLGGGRPWRYSLLDGQDIDVGFIKFFVSTEQFDWSIVPQPSPFDNRRFKHEVIDEWPSGLWNTFQVTVVQRRKQPHARISPEFTA